MRKLLRFLDPRVRKSKDSKYFYALDRHDARVVKVAGVLGLISLGFLIAGFINFLTISLAIGLAFAPILLLITVYHLIQYALMAQYPGFDVRTHRLKVLRFMRDGVKPRVAVFIPAAGEDPNIVGATARAAMAINYPSFEVFILDDSKEAIYAKLATRLGCRYVRRPNIGFQKKAGNMNYALRYVHDFQYILVLDADFKPRAEMLNELVPYADADVGIVQSPQHFPLTADVHKRSKVAYGAAYIQQDFYRISQVARNKYGAAICVGTNALYNIRAVQQVGGYEGVGAPRGWSHSEDVHTGLKIINTHNLAGSRYRIVYVPVQLAAGYCPDTHHSFYKQQNRWCTGSMQLLFSGKTLFSRHLSLAQRIIYGSNALYYYYTITVLISPLYLLVLTLLHQNGSWRYTLLFLPSLIINFALTPFLLRKKLRPLATSLVVLSNAYTFLQALILLIRRKPLGWEATGAQPGGRSLHFTQFKLLVVFCFIAFYLPTFGAIILNDKIAVGPTMFLVTLFLVALTSHVGFLYYVLVVTGKQRKHIDRKFYTALLVGLAVVAVGGVSFMYRGRYDVHFDRHSLVAFDKEAAKKQNPKQPPNLSQQSGISFKAKR